MEAAERGELSRAPQSNFGKQEEEVYEADDDGHKIPLLPSFFHGNREACTSMSKHSFDVEENLHKSSKEKNPRQRLASLDVFRGLTIAVMILVDDGGGAWPSINHSPWHGVTLADYVMPFFLFIVGMSLVLAFKNTRNRLDAFQKAGLRALKLFTLGVFLQGGYVHGRDNLNFGVDMRHLRIMGILQRISIGYLLVACCEILSKVTQVSRKKSSSLEVDTVRSMVMYPWQWACVLALTSVYLLILYGLRVPDWHFMPVVSKELTSAMESTVTRIKCGVRGDLGPACNAVGFLDRTLMGINHLYINPVYRRTKECSTNSPDYGPLPVDAPAWCSAPFDPEGLVSSLMASISCFIGAHYGHALLHFKNHERLLYEWIASGILLKLLGLLIEWLGMPANKPLYTISYVCVTGGVAGLVFSAIYVLVDVWNYRKPFLLLEWMGMNALLIFVLAAIEVFPALVQGFYWSSPQYNLVSLVEQKKLSKCLNLLKQ
ncbi:hypothetical protein GOP47_0004055 [Adiantum capillus-veneris]|uniref:Heparan-alpha-glucosaminide N-acetyltransferase catalytic domain-containing protein n=1 Tax=Adiantum capillus-veneris TaxID=13818 RepID=A0A9D4ZP64_ADICA|nr:hypothetical protein GOP47_0004055 [Adiantum capillus-veneris]